MFHAEGWLLKMVNFILFKLYLKSQTADDMQISTFRYVVSTFIIHSNWTAKSSFQNEDNHDNSCNCSPCSINHCSLNFVNLICWRVILSDDYPKVYLSITGQLPIYFFLNINLYLCPCLRKKAFSSLHLRLSNTGILAKSVDVSNCRQLKQMSIKEMVLFFIKKIV
jgi:hypothetical protein